MNLVVASRPPGPVTSDVEQPELERAGEELIDVQLEGPGGRRDADGAGELLRRPDLRRAVEGQRDGDRFTRLEAAGPDDPRGVGGAPALLHHARAGLAAGLTR